MRSAVYEGTVAHARLKPKRHRLSYRVFALLLDLDEMEGLAQRLKLFAHNRFGLFSFRDSDHGDGTTGGLRPWVESQLRAGGIAVDNPRIEVLCYPRILGYVFNPITTYFCADRDGTLRAILYEVCNTYGERMTYVIAAGEGAGPVRQTCPKLHFVSPFVPMECSYAFEITPPAERVVLKIDESDAEGPLLRASFAGRRVPLTDSTLWRLFWRYPLMTLKVTAGIHWEAIKLIGKGMRLHDHPKGVAKRRVTVVPQSAPHHVAGDRELERMRE